jgi:hypothetical protein
MTVGIVIKYFNEDNIMNLQSNKSYKSRDGKTIITVKKVNTGTNYIFGDINNPGNVFLPSGHILSEKYETDADLVELIELGLVS